ncbi:MAG: DNA repair protein RadA [Bacteroidetes bacterium GWE2_39_28]|nr:MAG: DNA repair protein RadA [Bacteroidetes bacterium GWE2_39_28]OFY14855.1 MAG: DNA repair protein RadA [Bacteroidetes bacterium GWF2_39_10]OFZ09041.1 MAG: DNA repair protein RadA [Bacteroidetes bacterium RIFOXYB2_FULL_39_7]OFZ10714.1 MAG: DNA repair protein RadA [Bacteroidetes bacterium RIFOXYC2_FULL_39_11]HCT93212.1 DNA repair protein RadA [Rikenellaceae bacterium]
MAKIKKAWFCTSCGNESAKWLGRCPACGEWNTLQEEIVSKDAGGAGSRSSGFLSVRNPKPELLSEITFTGENRISLGNGELDRILGGGLVAGSMVLIGGEPGIGKSTLSLQIPLHCPGLKTLYVSGEESANQIKLRAQRLGGDHTNCYILSETLLENILNRAIESQPQLIIIDSIQTVYSQLIESSPGSVSQVRECAAMLLKYAKETNTPVFLIGHITKDGMIAGPKILEHIVDVVLQFEGDTRHSYRILRSIKNRFGSTAELAIYEMVNTGLREVSNPSEMLIPMHKENLSGIAVSAMLDGTRPFLIETQALVSTAAYGTPQRSGTGFDVRRMNMLLAVLEKRAGFHLSSKDVFLNMAGGLKVSDPACDLAVVCAILSSNFDVSISQKYCFAAEVGLSGEIRPVAQTERRIAEAEKLGFEKIFISAYNKPKTKSAITVVTLQDIPDLVKVLFRQGDF